MRVPVHVIVRGWLVPPGQPAWVPLRRTIIVRPEHAHNELLMAHELQHVLQHERYRFTFYPRYIWGWIRAGFSPRKNPMEIQAHQAEQDPIMRVWGRSIVEATKVMLGER